MTTLVKLGEKIADLRKRRGLTQEDLAGLADMDRSFISEIENGHKNLSVTSLIRSFERASGKAAGCGFCLTFQFKQLILHAK